MFVRLIRAVLLIVVCSGFSHWAFAATRPVQASAGTVRFDSPSPGEMVVQVTIDGHGPFRFLVDTGSSHSAVTESLAARVGATPVARATMMTATGAIECLIVRLPTLAIGDAVIGDLLPTVLPAASASMLGDQLDGVIGQDFLTAHNFTIDYRRQHIVWGDGGAPAKAERLRLRSLNDRPLVELPQQSGETIVLVPDSGSTHLVVFSPQRFRLRSVTDDGTRVDTLGGSGRVRSVVVASLAVGRRTLREVSGGLVSGATFGPERGDGLLPLHLFDRVYFNNSEGYMSVE